jgi:hypothetical protein
MWRGAPPAFLLQGWIPSGPRENILIARSRALDLDNDLVGFSGLGFAGYLASRKSVALTV